MHLKSPTSNSTSLFFLWLSSCNFDDQFSSNFYRLCADNYPRSSLEKKNATHRGRPRGAKRTNRWGRRSVTSLFNISPSYLLSTLSLPFTVVKFTCTFFTWWLSSNQMLGNKTSRCILFPLICIDLIVIISKVQFYDSQITFVVSYQWTVDLSHISPVSLHQKRNHYLFFKYYLFTYRIFPNLVSQITHIIE